MRTNRNVQWGWAYFFVGALQGFDVDGGGVEGGVVGFDVGGGGVGGVGVGGLSGIGVQHLS